MTIVTIQPTIIEITVKTPIITPINIAQSKEDSDDIKAPILIY